ncbi:MAG: S8 family serine peptidase [Clostridia bacterium]|nr:S8 family serine peptidase [Clostridia bacterium]
MKGKKILSVFLSTVLLFVCLPVSISAQDTEAEYVEGEIIISSHREIEDNFGNLQTSSQSDKVGIDFEDVGIESVEEIETYSDDNVYIAEVDGNAEKICAELNSSGNITAEPNYILHTADFDMPSEVTNNNSVYAYQKWYFENKLHIPEAWQTHEVTGAGVTVAVIDNGFYVNAPDFPANLWLNGQGTPGWNTYTDSDDISPIFKSDGTKYSNTAHGSNVAGIIGMRPNGSGGIGAAYGAELMLIQAANYSNDDSNPSFTALAVIKGIDFAREHGADIINLSLGTTTNIVSIADAIDRACNAGTLVIAAAGNSGAPTSSAPYYPAALSNVIGVMAIDKDDPTQLAGFSNYDTSSGQYYDIAVPGHTIVGCNSASTGYALLSGTSQASPLAASVAALYMEKYPDNTIEDFRNDMLASATEYVHAFNSTKYYFKSLNALKLLDYCSPPVINVNLSTDATIYNGYFQGLNEGYTDINDYISVAEDTGSMVFTPTENGNGTGSTIEIYNSQNKLFRTLTVVIFGDINGDCKADGQDALLISCKLSGLDDFELSGVQEYAADVSFDNVVGLDDCGIITDYAIMKDYISQIR